MKLLEISHFGNIAANTPKADQTFLSLVVEAQGQSGYLENHTWPYHNHGSRRIWTFSFAIPSRLTPFPSYITTLLVNESILEYLCIMYVLA